MKDDDAFNRLCKVIKDRRLLPEGKEENWAGNITIRLDKALSSNELFIPEMVCFCDIPVEKGMLDIHTNKYSKFGLAFEKKWMAQQRGASPVFYLAKGSCCTDHRFQGDHSRRRTDREKFFDLAAHDWMIANERGIPPEKSSRSDNMFLWYVLSYCKFFDETLNQEDFENFYMEREWRTIGQVCFAPENIEMIFLPEGFKERFLEDSDLNDLSEKIHTL